MRFFRRLQHLFLVNLRLAVLCLAAVAWAADLEYDIETIAGSDRLGDGGPALSAQLSQPQGLAFDRSGNLYIADADNHRVRKVAPNGVITTVAGVGHAGFRGDGGPAEQARLFSPYGVAIDASGNVLIADTYNHRVRAVSPGGEIRTVAGTGVKGSAGDAGPAPAAQLMAPRNVAVDPAGNVYIAEFEGHRIRKIAPSGVITTVAGTGVAGFNADGLGLAAQLSSPGAMAVGPSGALYVVDIDNRRVRRLLNGVLVTVYGPVRKDPRTGANIAAAPSGVACDRFGNVFVAESSTGRIFRLANGEAVEVWVAAPGVTGPRDLAVAESGSILAADGRRVVAITTNGAVTPVAGSGAFGFDGDGGLASLAQLNAPRGLIFDPAGNLYVADSGNYRIRRIDAAGVITTVAGAGKSNDDNRAPLDTALKSPSAVAFDSQGSLVISDTGNHRVRRLTGGILQVIAGSGEASRGGENMPGSGFALSSPGKLATDWEGNLLVADTGNHRVVRISPAGIVTTFAGNGTPGYAGDGGRAVTAQLRSPASVAVDSARNVFIADTGNHRVRQVGPEGTITTIAGDGAWGVSGNHLAGPCGVALYGSDLLISDSATVRRLRGSELVTIAGTGGLGYDGDGGPATRAELNYPCDLAVDAEGRIWIADSGNHRIRRLTPREQVVAPKPVVRFSVVHAATLREGPVAPGQIVSLFGEDLGGDVFFDGQPATVLHASAEQVNVVAPRTLAGRSATTVEIRLDGKARAVAVVPVTPAAPALFTTGKGAGQAVALNQDGSVNSAANPAARGSVIVLFGTGQGENDPATVLVFIGGSPAEVLWAGPAPGFEGLLQINARVPGAFTPGGILPVILRSGGAPSPDGVTVAVK